MYKVIIYLSASALLIALVVANVIVSGQLSTAGEKLRQMEAEKAAISLDNQVLEASILNGTSLTKLATIAQDQGFVRPEAVMTLQTPNQTVAYKN